MTAKKKSNGRRLSALHVGGLAVLLVIGLWLVEWLLGRQFLSDSGFGAWTGAWSPNTSQWLADPYTFSHVLHGMFFCWILLPARKRLDVRSRFLVACLLEVAWEMLENSPFIIERYRTATAARGYVGDSILNSTCDLMAAMAGFWMAWKCDWKWVLAFVLAIELLCLYFVRDNLTLNILMLLHPFESIKQWQMSR